MTTKRAALDVWISRHTRRYTMSEASGLGREAEANLRAIGYIQ